MRRDLSGKVAIVTGAGGLRGIGRTTALELAQAGADVVAVDLPYAPETRPADEQDTWRGVHSVADEVRALGRRALAVEGSVCNESDMRRMLDETLAAFGNVDILVVNAAARPGADRVPVVDLEKDELARVLDVNLVGAFLCCKVVGRHMQARQQGAVVIVASQSARIGKARLSAYAASKFGQIGLMQAFAHEMGPHNVRVNAVCPGLVDTARIDWSVQTDDSAEADVEERRERLLADQARHIPLGRVGAPEDVAATIAFLCSDGARHITGQSVGVDGGSRM